MASSISRRGLLLRTLQISAGGAFAAGAAGRARARAAQCVDLDAMDPGEQSERRGSHWTAMSPNPQQPCAKCAFFSPTTGSCGNCGIFNGPTVATGHCDSWSPKSDASQ
jgi:hypothetical protein